MGEIPNKIRENVRAVLLSKTDGKGVLVNDFLRDYKRILQEPLMYSSLGYSNLPEFLKAIPDVCRLEYYENIMAFKLFGIAKPNTYASSWHKKAEGVSDVSDSEPEPRRRQRSDRNRGGRGGGGRERGGEGRGDLLNLGSEIDEEWAPNCRGLFTICFPNRISSLNTVEEVTVKFSEVGPVAEVNIIPSLVFVRFRDSNAAKKALALWGDEIRLRRAEERPPPRSKNSGGDRCAHGGGDHGGRGGDCGGDCGDRGVGDRGGGRGGDRGGGGRGGGRESNRDRDNEPIVKPRVQQFHNSIEVNGLDDDDECWDDETTETSALDKKINKTEESQGASDKKVNKTEESLSASDKKVNKTGESQGHSAWDKKGHNAEESRGHSSWNKKDASAKVNNGYSSAQNKSNSAVETKGYNAHKDSKHSAEEKNVSRVGKIMDTSNINLKATRNGSEHVGHVDGLLGRAPGDSNPGILNDLLERPIKTYLNHNVGVAGATTTSFVSQPSAGVIGQPLSPQIKPQTTTRSDAGQNRKEEIQVYIGNIHSSVEKPELEKLVAGYNTTGCRVVTDTKNTYKKYAFVEFVSLQEAERCIAELNETELNGRTLRCRLGDRQNKGPRETRNEGQDVKAVRRSALQCPCSYKCNGKLDQSRGLYIGNWETGVRNTHLSPKQSSKPSSTQQMSPKPTVSSSIPQRSPNPSISSQKIKVSPKPTVPSPIPQLSPNPSLSSQKNKISPKISSPDFDEDDNDEMPPLEENITMIQRTIVNDKFDTGNKKPLRQPGSYVPKGSTESPTKMPPLETFSPTKMPALETNSPKKPLVPVPTMPKPNDTLKVFDSRELEEEMLQSSDEEDSVQLFISNFPYGTQERELLEMFDKQEVEQIIIMNNSITNRSTYAFVTVSNIEQAQLAILQHDQSLLKGRRLTVGMASLTANSKKKKAREADPIARITCTVGASSEPGLRHVSVGDAYSLPSSSGRPDSSDMRNSQPKLTHTLKTYAIIVSKLRGEADYRFPVQSRIKVYVTHVEESGNFFWGQVLADETHGIMKNLETLQRITSDLQNPQSRVYKLREGQFGRCTALYEGDWYRAWNTNINKDGLCEVLYIDYGNMSVLPYEEMMVPIPAVWNLPPMAKPFRLAGVRSIIEAGLGKSVADLNGKTVVLEIVAPGNGQSNFVTNVRVLPDEAMP